MKRARSIQRVLVLVLFCILLLPAHSFAKESATQPKTPPPPDVSPFTGFDPDFEYLEKGQGYLTDQGDNKANIWGETFATKRVDEIGVQLTLQRWTGSAWIDVYYGASVEDTNAAYVYSSISNVPVLSGYYYRTVSYHWIKEGSVTESGYRYSASLLMS